MKLDGKTALVTGGGTGIGAAIAQRLSADGAKVCLLGRRAEPLEQVRALMPAERVAICVTDVTNPADVDRGVAAAVELGDGRLDIVVNNAGIGPFGSIDECDLDEWNQTLAVNLTAPMLVIRAAIPPLRRSGGGLVVNISSVAGRRPFPGPAAYSVSKAGLIMLTQQAAVDYGPEGIRFNAICPGWVRTPMSESEMATVIKLHGGTLDSALARVSRDTPLKRVAELSKIANIVSFLASDEA
ncbi:SDR family oxidoreductase [Rhodococcus sp. APC 3903]|uniref:SDR family NAD(P)-dependent oxidoreductase n=1 Tax=Rhodococcus sp. APC 3903 TaxID=3035193 RepID=UPI0025B4F205|nr:SDR family oxidoreductase [Rhodococcus sp. APC 3903]MDN3460707.1 SDR family oxidoreductase [Rhodococcus sp. APC 3903]